MKLLRWSVYCVAGFLALAVIGFLAVWLVLRSSLPMTEGEVVGLEVTAPVELWRDSDGLLTVRAENWSDAYFGLGYAHAQERLAQIMMMRSAALGELSAVAGPTILGFDMLMRTLGFERNVREQFDRLAPENRQALNAYAAGINSFLDTRDGLLPPEFLQLGRPARWRPWDSLLWAKLIALRLSGNWRDEIRNARLDEVLSPDDWNDIYPKELGASHSIMQKGAVETSRPSLFSALQEQLISRSASNAWAATGNRTSSGKPLLANDPHLLFQVPSTWYLARLETPDGVLAGATVPGMPAILVGHNGHIAWGFTSAESDTQDLVIETIDPTDPSRYLTPEGPVPFETRQETIKVSGGASVPLTVRRGRFGPVVSDIAPAEYPTLANDEVATLAWPALTGRDTTFGALLALNQARSWADFRLAMRQWQTPQVNIFYADIEGHIGFWSPGLIPIRVNDEGDLPIHASDRRSLWDGFIPFDDLPHQLDPEEGWVANANNRIVGAGYPYKIASRLHNPARYTRILENLEKNTGHIDPDQSEQLQLDSVSLSARRMLPLLLTPSLADGNEGPKFAEAISLLSHWNGSMDYRRPEPLIYHAWLRELNRIIFADELGTAFSTIAHWNPEAIERVLTTSPRWCRGQAAECVEALRKSLRNAIALLRQIGTKGPLADLQWGDFHKATFAHPLFRNVPVLGDLTSLSIPTSGDNYTINMGTSVYRNESRLFEHVHGASLRAVMDLGDLDNSRFMIDTGQSGNPLSPHYGDFLTRWRDGAMLTLNPAERFSARILALRP